MPVVRGIVIVQFQGVFAEANLSAFRCCSRFQIAATILIHGSIRPEIIGIAVGAENVRSRDSGVPVACEAVGRFELRRRRIVGIRAASLDRDRGHIADVAVVGIHAVIHVSGFAPVVVRAGLGLAVDGLKVHERHRHLANLHADLRRLGAIVCVSDRDGRIHRAAAGTGHERVAVHVADVRIRDTIRFGLDCPVKVAGLIDNVHTVALGNQTEIRRGTKVQRDR